MSASIGDNAKNFECRQHFGCRGTKFGKRALGFAYAQLGQENTFPWPDQAQAYPMQMKALAALRDTGKVKVETMGDSGRRFKRAFTTTPAQAQVMLNDPFGNTNPAQNTVWYQSRFYRANLHLNGDLPFLRDIAVYSDLNAQPFLKTATRNSDVEQRMPPVLDGYHWSRAPGSSTEEAAGAFFTVPGFNMAKSRLHLSGAPKITETGSSLLVTMPVGEGRILNVRFDEKKMTCSLSAKTSVPLSLSFEWAPPKASLTKVEPQRVSYRWQEFDYGVDIENGKAAATFNGWTVTGNDRGLTLRLAQPK